jgi:hypothetical protein
VRGRVTAWARTRTAAVAVWDAGASFLGASLRPKRTGMTELLPLDSACLSDDHPYPGMLLSQVAYQLPCLV